MTGRSRRPAGHSKEWTSGKTGPNGRRFCKGCGVEVPKGRRSWCSGKCMSDWNLRWYWPSLRYALQERDGLVCGSCGFDVGLAQRIRRRLWFRSQLFSEPDCLKMLLKAWGVPNHRNGADLWDADHRVPLIDGGAFGLENLWILCLPCHRAKTAAESTARAQRRRRAEADEAVRELGL